MALACSADRALQTLAELKEQGREPPLSSGHVLCFKGLFAPGDHEATRLKVSSVSQASPFRPSMCPGEPQLDGAGRDRASRAANAGATSRRKEGKQEPRELRSKRGLLTQNPGDVVPVCRQCPLLSK